jgi:predicted dinucleotide-binding enzyme
VGVGLARRWRLAGHIVKQLGRQGGDASNADVVLLAVPSAAIADALMKVRGLAGKVMIDATNAFAGRDEAYPSLAHEVKATIGGPAAKAFNLNFAYFNAPISQQLGKPRTLYAADNDARAVTEQVIYDAGFEPVWVGGLEQARALEDHAEQVFFPINQYGCGPFVCRYVKPGEPVFQRAIAAPGQE